VERDEEGSITSRCQRDGTTVRRLDCWWERLCCFKSIGKQRTEPKGHVLMMKFGHHRGHELADEPFQYVGHLKSSEEFLEAMHQAKEHRQPVLPYTDSRRLVNAEDLGVIVSAKDYSNTVRKELPDKSKPKTIAALLRTLEDNGCVYRSRFSVDEDETGTVTSRKLI
jgi:hypothetical protein